MPKSKGRKKPSKQRYQLHPHRKQQAKSSPRWYAPLMLVVMGAGVVLIVWNFLRPSESFNAGVIFCCAAVANPVSDMPGHNTVTVTPWRLSSR